MEACWRVMVLGGEVYGGDVVVEGGISWWPKRTNRISKKDLPHTSPSTLPSHSPSITGVS